MKTSITYATVILDWWKRILGGVVTAIIATSIAVAAESPSPVNLGTSGDFVLLAKTSISVTGTTAIVGDLGISPAAATFITGLGLIADPSNIFATTSLVTGKIYAADYTSPTSTKLTTAVSDMETAYTDAAGRKNPDFTELYAGDVTGKTLVPGVYKWGTGVLVSAGGVTVSGSANDVWIFQIAQNLELANGAIVTLTGGALSSNIFWQVAGQVTLGTTAAMKGIILCQTAIVIGTGGTLNGRALAQTAITLDANAVTMPTTTYAIKKSFKTQRYSFVHTYRDHSIEFTAPSTGKATITIVTIHGQNIITLFDGEVQAGKKNHVLFTVRGLAKGYYLSIIKFNGVVMPYKMIQIN